MLLSYLSPITKRYLSFLFIHKSVILEPHSWEIHFCVKGFFLKSYTFAAEK